MARRKSSGTILKTGVTGLDSVKEAFARLENQFSNWRKTAVEENTRILHERILVRGGHIDDHTLEKLAEMGHPYARRNPQNPHEPPYIVHRQSGQLLADIKNPEYEHLSTKSHGKVKIDESSSPHARDVIFGNSVMIARDFMFGSLQEVKEDVERNFLEGARKIVKEKV